MRLGSPFTSLQAKSMWLPSSVHKCCRNSLSDGYSSPRSGSHRQLYGNGHVWHVGFGHTIVPSHTPFHRIIVIIRLPLETAYSVRLYRVLYTSLLFRLPGESCSRAYGVFGGSCFGKIPKQCCPDNYLDLPPRWRPNHSLTQPTISSGLLGYYCQSLANT